jgi:hypothetical protein
MSEKKQHIEQYFEPPPEGYFENLPNSIWQRIQEQENTRQANSKPLWQKLSSYWPMGLAASVLLTIGLWQYQASIEKQEINNISDSEIVSYLEKTQLHDDDLMHQVNMADDKINIINNLHVPMPQNETQWAELEEIVY